MDLAGVFPPVPTPCRNDVLDSTALRLNAQRYLDAGVAGLVVLGSNGEAPLVDDEEADRAIEAVREIMPSERVLIAGTGRESTRATIAATRRAAAAGADCVLVRTPSYFKNLMTADAFTAHYRAVADASPVPVLLYNVTVYTGVDLPLRAVGRLAEHPNIIGMKESSGDIGRVVELIEQTPDEFTVLAGSASVFLAAISAGADGGVLAAACVVPEVYVRLYRLVRSAQLDEARALHEAVLPLAKLVTSVWGIGGLKAAAELAGYPSGPPRAPLRPAPPEAIDEIRRALNAVASRASVRLVKP